MPDAINAQTEHETPESTATSEPGVQTENHVNTPNVAASDSESKRRREPRAPVSQAVVHINLKLRSRHTQRVYQRSYGTAQRALYTLSVMLRVYANDAEADQVGEVVNQMIATVRDDLAEEIARMEAVAETQGVNLGAVEYTQPQSFEAEISTPKAGQYLGLLREMDRFISLMDLLWLSGVYTDAQYNTGSYQWQRRLIKLANRLRNLAQRAMTLSRREGAQMGFIADLLGEADAPESDADNEDKGGE